MFEFWTSYRDPDWHKEQDKPFIFPPEGVDPKTPANLIEIYGKNGSGKTTLLNILALALGYPRSEKELDNKPALKQKLQFLKNNKTLEYRFRICCDKPEPMELKIERIKGKTQVNCVNSKSVDRDTLSREYDVVFLTEDDPKKVITVSKGKLVSYFEDLYGRLDKLGRSVSSHLNEIDKYSSFKSAEKKLLDDIRSQEDKIKKEVNEQSDLQDKIQKLRLKIDTQGKIELLNNQEEIGRTHKTLLGQYDKLQKKEDRDILLKIEKARSNLSELRDERNSTDSQIRMTCESLRTQGKPISHERLLTGDYAEFNEVKRSVEDNQKHGAINLDMVEKMISLFGEYSPDENVPIIRKPVREVVGELWNIKVEFSRDRVLNLLKTLENHLDAREHIIYKVDAQENKIAELKQQLSEREGIDRIEKEFQDVQKRYLALQKVLSEDTKKIVQDYKLVAHIEGDPEKLKSKLQDLEVDAKAADRLKSKLEENLNLLREKAERKPTFDGKQKELENLLRAISHLREMLSFWITILRDPVGTKNDIPKLEKTSETNTLSNYNKFIESVGQSLGSQFEPVLFGDGFHDVKYYDIERETFSTKDDRKIPIANLSQGQSKITALTGSLKEMNPSKKGIVLIDEIAELDPRSLEKVKKDLKAKYDEGSLLLALLVRPTYDLAQQPVEIRGWG